MSETQKLLPCPFCGGKARLKSAQVAEDAVETWVECKGCFMATDRLEDAYSDPEGATDLWNRRATSPEDAKLRDALIVARQQLVTLGGEHSLYDPDGDRIQAAVLTQIDMALNGDLDDARDRVSAALQETSNG